MFLREYCIHNLHKIISHYWFHLPLWWKSQLKGNKLSCLFEGSLLGPYYNWSSLQCQCNVGCYMVWCVEIQAQMQQLLSSTVDLLSPLLPPTPTFTQDLSVMVAYSLHYSSTLVQQSCSVSNRFICSVYIVSFCTDLLTVYFIHI